MGAYIRRRLLQSIVVIFGVSVLVFFLLTACPGRPGDHAAGRECLA